MNHFERFDPRNGLLLPWYTHGALDKILAWDLADKVILEWGGGHSTKWWSSRAEYVYTIESDRHWHQQISGWNLPNVSLELRNVHPADDYIRVPDGCHPDIAIIDGEHRRACLEAALTLPRPLVLIFDNWMQDGFRDEFAETMMHPFEGRFHIQPDHKNHAGHPWQTAIWYLGEPQ